MKINAIAKVGIVAALLVFGSPLGYKVAKAAYRKAKRPCVHHTCAVPESLVVTNVPGEKTVDHIGAAGATNGQQQTVQPAKKKPCKKLTHKHKEMSKRQYSKRAQEIKRTENKCCKKAKRAKKCECKKGKKRVTKCCTTKKCSR